MCMADYDDESWKVYRAEDRRAAKPHKCDECRRVIQRGERYHFATGYDGVWGVFRMCAHCWVAATWLLRECNGWLHTAIEDDIKEHVDEYQRYDLARIYVGMRRKWKRFRGEGLLPLPKMPAVTP